MKELIIKLWRKYFKKPFSFDELLPKNWDEDIQKRLADELAKLPKTTNELPRTNRTA